MFVVGKDFGAWPAYYFALKHPERALGVVTLGVPFLPPESIKSSQGPIPEGVYTLRWRVCTCSSIHLRLFSFKRKLNRNNPNVYFFNALTSINLIVEGNNQFQVVIICLQIDQSCCKPVTIDFILYEQTYSSSTVFKIYIYI